MDDEDDNAIVSVSGDQQTPLTEAARQEITTLAARQFRANGFLMKAVTYVGGQVEGTLKALPASVREQIDDAARQALQHSYTVAAKTGGGSLGANFNADRLHRVLATMSGALGGVGGVPTALAELPVATTMIFRAVQTVAAQYGKDPASEETRMQCLSVFGAGAPGPDDDGIDTAFFGARLGITGPALNALIGRVAPRFASILSQKLATQTVPVLGAVAGAGTNYAFMDYYIEVAHVHFSLRSLCREHGAEAVEDAFHVALAACKAPVVRA